jgi:hypothetical protein
MAAEWITFDILSSLRCYYIVIAMESDDDFESGEPVDRAGESILRLLQKAADTADQPT